MITREQEVQLLNELEEDLDIVDVYFHKGKLHVVNDYDVEAVQAYFQTHPLAADIQLELPDFEPLY